MPAVLIATTRQTDLEPLGTGGHSAISVAATLRAALLRSLSPDHAALLAEPFANPARGEIDWYAEIAGPAVPLPGLPPAERAEAGVTLARLGDDIRALAEQLAAAPAEADRFLGEMLRLALTVPDESHVLVTAGRPVLIGWGHRSAGPRHPNPLIIGARQPIEARMPILPPPPAILGDAVRRPPGGLWWAALALAALLWLLPAWLLSRAMAAPVPCLVAPLELAMMRRLDTARVAGAKLAARLGVLRAEAATPCPPGVAPPPAAPDPGGSGAAR